VSPRRPAVALLALLVAAPAHAAAAPPPEAAHAAPPREAAPAVPAWEPRPATHGVTVERDVPVRMSDGVVLSADVYRPAAGDGSPAPGRFPVVLTQDPYNKNVPTLNFANEYLVRRGYVQVVADVRGTGSSGGTWDSFGTREQRDGVELVRWAAGAARGWSDGRVATYGASYMAINQLLTAAQQPSALKAAFPIVPAGDVYRDVVASGGQVDAGFIPLWLGLVTATGVVPPAYTADDPVRGLSTVGSHAAGAASFQGPQMLSALTGGEAAYDGPFYRSRSPLSVVDDVEVPTFLVGGWHDLFQRGTPMLYQRLRANGVPTRLLVGPWTHVQGSLGEGLPADGVPSLDALALRWFDHHVRGVPDPALGTDVAPVTYAELGTDRWRTADDWLDADALTARTYRLAGQAAPGSPGRLTRGRASGGPDAVLPNPAAGLCTRSTSQWTGGLLLAGTPCEDDARVDDATATVYETAPLQRRTRLFGPVAAHLWVSTTASDGMVALRVEDVAPDGTADVLTGGWQVLSLRARDRAREQTLDGRVVQPFHPYTEASVRPVPSGEPVPVSVEVFPTGAALAPGHRLRLSVTAYDTPHLVAPLPQAVDAAGGVLRVHHDAAHPSRLVVPVRPG
jgi:uncharacterized protein